MSNAKPKPTYTPDGCILWNKPPKPMQLLDELVVQLRLCLARLESCDRTDAGDYMLKRDAKAGKLRALELIWSRVTMLSIRCKLHAVAAEDIALTDALSQLIFAIPFVSQGSWPDTIVPRDVAKVRALTHEIEAAAGDAPDLDGWWTFTEAREFVQNNSAFKRENQATGALRRWVNKHPKMKVGKGREGRHDPNMVRRGCENKL